MNLAETLLNGGKPDDVALVVDTAEVTYAGLRSAVQHIASMLREVGVQPGDRVAIAAANSLFWAASYLGAIRCGATSVPIAAKTAPKGVAEILEWTGCRVICLGTDYRAAYQPYLEQAFILHESSFHYRAGVFSPPEFPAFPVAPKTALAALMLTSGSTAKPRAVMVSHANVLANSLSIQQCLQLGRQDRVLCLLPLSYCFGTSLLHTHLACGGSIVLSSAMFQPAHAFRLMREHHCTGFAGVPSIFQVLLRAGQQRQVTFPSCITKIQQAGGRLAPQLVAELRAAAPHASVYVMYGQTEATARLTCMPPEALAAKPGSVGLPIPGVAIEIVHSDGRLARENEVGEVVASGDSIARGYWDAPELTATMFRDGKLHTGDIGYFDADGFLHLVGRMQDFIKSGGVRTSVGELEESILAVPDVVEAAAVPIPDRVRGEAVRLFVVVTSESMLTTNKILQHCRQSVSTCLVPREVVFLDELPKNSSGKVAKSALVANQYLSQAAG